MPARARARVQCRRILGERAKREAGRTEYNGPKTGKRYAHFPKNGPSPVGKKKKKYGHMRDARRAQESGEGHDHWPDSHEIRAADGRRRRNSSIQRRAVNKKINLDPSPPTNEILVIIAGNLSCRVLPGWRRFFHKIRFFRPSSFRH